METLLPQQSDYPPPPSPYTRRVWGEGGGFNQTEYSLYYHMWRAKQKPPLALLWRNVKSKTTYRVEFRAAVCFTYMFQQQLQRNEWVPDKL